MRGIQQMYEQRNRDGQREFSQQAIAEAFGLGIGTVNRMVRSSMTNIARTRGLADIMRALTKTVERQGAG